MFSTKEPKFLVRFYFYTLSALIIFDGKVEVVFLDAENEKKVYFQLSVILNFYQQFLNCSSEKQTFNMSA